MGRFWDAGDPQPFVAYSVHHLAMLLLFGLAVAALYVSRTWLRQEQRGRTVRYGLIALLAVSEIALNVWYIAEGVYSAAYTLPLELCSISLYMCIAMLLLNSRAIFQIVYFTGIGGALQALLTPALFYDFPHFRFIEFFIAHMAIILSVLYMVWVERMRPTLKSIAVTFVFLNALLVVVWFVNAITGGNYMFLMGKPETPSLLDFLGPYPYYLLSLEAVALVLFLILYLPFARNNHRQGSPL
jgi:hypothetical integral membrane protein (TIGR02206 family)